MPKTDSSSKSAEAWDRLELLFKIGVGILFASGITAFNIQRLLDLWPVAFAAQYLCKLLSVLLFITVLILVFAWIFAVFGEMRMLRKHFENYVHPQPVTVYMWTVGFCMLLGGLGYTTDSPFLFGALLVLYHLGDLWGNKIRDNQLALMVEDIRRSGRELTKEQGAIVRYYLKRPQLERITTQMFFSFVALLLAEASMLMTESTSGNCGPPAFPLAEASMLMTESTVGVWLRFGAYVILFLNLTVGNLPVMFWRKSRDRHLGTRYSF